MTEMTDLEQKKQLLRTEMRKKRDQLSKLEHAAKSRQICKRAIEQVLLPMLKVRDRITIFSYVPYQSEIDLFPILEWAWTAEQRVVFPVADEKNKRMQLRTADSFNDMKPNRWGILEPGEEAPIWDGSADVVLLPGLAFDRLGARLGYGGGYYDRWIAKQKEEGMKPLLLALAFELQLVDEVPHETHDMKADLIITEASMIHIVEE